LPRAGPTCAPPWAPCDHQFLSEMDGVTSSNEGVLILAATNAPWHVDPPSAGPPVDRILFVPPPDAPPAPGVLRILTRGKPIQDIDYDHLAKKPRLLRRRSQGGDGPGHRAQTSRRDEGWNPKPLTTRILAASAGQVKPSTKSGLRRRELCPLFQSGGTYDDILKYLKM